MTKSNVILVSLLCVTLMNVSFVVPKTPVEQMINQVEKACKITVSAVAFHISLLIDQWKRGSSFGFNRVAHDSFDGQLDGKVYLARDEHGAIIALHDGCKTPLVLGSIPQSQEHIHQLKKEFNINLDKGIAIYSLNKKFERDWAGLTQLTEEPNPEILHKYPTIDYCAPLVTDLIRVTRDLKYRDERDEGVALVHCKAGRARSATALIAYLMSILHDEGFTVTPEEIEAYLKRYRSEVRVNGVQHAVLLDFQQQLTQAGSFERLCQVCAQEIDARDHEVTFS